MKPQYKFNRITASEIAKRLNKSLVNKTADAASVVRSICELCLPFSKETHQQQNQLAWQRFIANRGYINEEFLLGRALEVREGYQEAVASRNQNRYVESLLEGNSLDILPLLQTYAEFLSTVG